MNSQEFNSPEDASKYPVDSLRYCIVILKQKISELPEPMKDIPVHEFEMSVRLSNTFKRENIQSLRGLLSYSTVAISQWSGLGLTGIKQL